MFVICYIYAFLFTIYIQFVTERLHRGGFGLQGRRPLRQSSTKLTLSTERGERGGAAAAPAGRKLPQEARAARSFGKGENSV